MEKKTIIHPILYTSCFWIITILSSLVALYVSGGEILSPVSVQKLSHCIIEVAKDDDYQDKNIPTNDKILKVFGKGKWYDNSIIIFDIIGD